MTTVHDVPADLLIERVAEFLKKEDNIKPPEWASLVKTGVHKEKSPVQSGWWYRRVAAVLRKVYLEGPIGSSRLGARYGGREDRRAKPFHARKGSRSVARHTLQQLEAAGYISFTEGRGRVISPKGQSLLDNLAHEVMKEMAKENPELTKYM